MSYRPGDPRRIGVDAGRGPWTLSMLHEMTFVDAGATLAESVRSLAARARRILKRPTDERAARELLREIEALERNARPPADGDLTRWLASLRTQVERHGKSVA